MARKSSRASAPKKYQTKEISWYNKKYSIEDIAKSAISTAKTVASLINVELHDQYVTTTTNVTTTVLLEQLVNPAIGTGPAERQGNSIKLNYIQDRALYVMATADTSVFLRVIYFKWKDSDAPTASDVIVSTSNPVVQHINKNSSNKMSVLSDVVYHFDDSKRQGTYMEYQKSFKSFHLEWNEDGTTAKTRLYRMSFSDSVTGLSRNISTHAIFIDN